MSRNIYKQQIGRVLSFNDNEQAPVIIDLVKNIYLSNIISNRRQYSSIFNNEKHIFEKEIELTDPEEFIYLVDETIEYQQLRRHLYDALTGNDQEKIDSWYEKYLKKEDWKIM